MDTEERNRIRNRKNYYIKRALKEHKDYLDAVEKVRILNRDIVLMNEVRNIAQKILSR
jgi:hypothetical protein